MNKDTTEKPYRLGALAYIYHPSDNKILLVQLNGYKDDEWNVPGGGREKDESAEANIIREITEELGWTSDQFKLEKRAVNPLQYDFPPSLAESGNPVGLAFRGQQKDQFLVRFTGKDPDVILLQSEELKNAEWCSIDELDKRLKFPGQLDMTLAALKEFGLV